MIIIIIAKKRTDFLRKQKKKVRTSPIEAKEVKFDSIAKSRKTENKKKNKKMHFKYI